MIVHLYASGPPEVSLADDLVSLSVNVDAGSALSDMNEHPLFTPDEGGEHVWLNIEELRSLARPLAMSPAWDDDFKNMIAYARSQGWVDLHGRALRAHVRWQ